MVEAGAHKGKGASCARGRRSRQAETAAGLGFPLSSLPRPRD